MSRNRKQERDAEREQDLARLREWLKPGDTVYTIVRQVSASGMSRHIGLVLIGDEDGRGRRSIIHPNVLAARVLGLRVNKNGDALVVGGCGMDMGFHVVSSLSAALYPEGFGCVGEKCQSNDHSNGDRDYIPNPHGQIRTTECEDAKPCNVREHWHRSGDYALRQEWL